MNIINYRKQSGFSKSYQIFLSKIKVDQDFMLSFLYNFIWIVKEAISAKSMYQSEY